MKRFNLVTKLIGIALITFSVLSCGKEKKVPITFNVRGANERVFLPTSARSCKDESLNVSTESVAKSYVTFDNPEIEIDKAVLQELYPELDFDSSSPNSLKNNPTKLTFNIIGITVKIASPNINGGKYSCIIAGEELSYLFYSTAGTWTPTSITYDANYDRNGDGILGDFRGTAYYRTANYKSCPLKCGGIGLKDGLFTAPVNFEIVVISSLKNEDGTQTDVPYKITTTGTVRNAL